MLLDLGFSVMIPAVIRQYFTTCLSFYYHPYISQDSPQTCKGAFFCRYNDSFIQTDICRI